MRRVRRGYGCGCERRAWSGPLVSGQRALIQRQAHRGVPLSRGGVLLVVLMPETNRAAAVAGADAVVWGNLLTRAVAGSVEAAVLAACCTRVPLSEFVDQMPWYIGRFHILCGFVVRSDRFGDGASSRPKPLRGGLGRWGAAQGFNQRGPDRGVLV